MGFNLGDPATQALIQSMGGIITAVTTVVLAVLTYRYVKLTGSMLEEARVSRAPNIYIDIETTPQWGMKLIVGNSGLSPAHRVQLKVKDSIPWRQIDNCCNGFASMDVVKHGISYLAAGRTLKYEVGFFEWPEVKTTGGAVEFIVSYDDHSKNQKILTFRIDLCEYLSVLPESFTNPESEIAKAIKRKERDDFVAKALWRPQAKK